MITPFFHLEGCVSVQCQPDFNCVGIKKYHDFKTNYHDTHTLKLKICIPDVQRIRVIQIHFPLARQCGFLQGAARSCITCLVLIFILHQLLLSLQELLMFWLPMLLRRHGCVTI